MPDLPIRISANLAPSDAHSESASNGIMYVMAAVAMLLMAAYFAISVLAISR